MTKTVSAVIGGVVALLVAVIVGFGLGKSAISVNPVVVQSNEDASLGAQSVHVLQENFAAGIKVNGTAFVDSSRNVSAGTISGSTITGSGALVDSATVGNNIGSGTASSTAILSVGNTVTSTVSLGAVNKPVCLAAPALTAAAGNSAATVYWYVFTTTGVQALVTKPTWCP